MMSMPNAVKPLASPLPALLFVIPCVGCWALIAALALGIPKSLSIGQFVFWSNLVSTAVLCGAACGKGRARAFLSYGPGDIPHLCLLAGLGISGYYTLLYTALATVQHPAQLTVVQYTWPVLTALFSAALHRERLSPRAWAALALAIGAVAVALGLKPADGAPATIVLGVAVAAVMFALYSLLSRDSQHEPYTYMTMVFGAATVLSLVWLFVRGEALISVGGRSPVPWATIVVLVLINGALVNGISYVWWLEALRRAPADFVAPWVSMTPLLSTSILWLHGQDVSGTHWIGVLMILVAVLLSLTAPASASAAPRTTASPDVAVATNGTRRLPAQIPARTILRE
jgi:drug/metabolite transporter (DMT)-like permease